MSNEEFKSNKLSRYERGLYLLFFVLIFVLLLKITYLNTFIDTTHKYDYSKLDSLHLRKKNTISFEKDKNKKQKNEYKVNQKVVKKNKNELKNSNEINKINSLTVSKKIININTSNIEELITIKGIGKKTAEQIIFLRNKKGKFSDLNELLDVKGIGKKKLSKLKQFIKL